MWFKEDADERARSSKRARSVAGLKGGAPPESAITRVPEPAITPNTYLIPYDRAPLKIA